MLATLALAGLTLPAHVVPTGATGPSPVPRAGLQRTGPNPAAKSAPAPKAMPQSAVRFEPIAFSDLPGWEADDTLAAFKAFLTSCDKVVAAVRRGTLSGVAMPPPGLLGACDDASRLAGRRMTRADARAFFESHFQPHRVSHASPEGLLTGYFEAALAGARTRSDKFPVPIYRRPPDLVNLVDEAQRGAVGANLTHARRTAQGRIVPFPTRAEIEAGALAGQGLELLWLADAVDVFFLQIQGSGRIRLADGTSVRVSYDGKNGHPYASIGRHLIDSGRFAADKVSLDSLAAWLRADKARGTQVMAVNASYVFFKELAGDARNALGTLDIPLTPGRSLAIDASVHPLGTPVYVSAPTLTDALQAGPFRRLMIAHDVGSAIKGPERGDIYFGSGRAAGKLAGVTKHPGNLFVLLPVGAGTASAPPTAASGWQTRRAGASGP